MRKGQAPFRYLASAYLCLLGENELLLFALPRPVVDLIQRIHELGRIGVVAVEVVAVLTDVVIAALADVVVAALEQRLERTAHALILLGAPTAVEAKQLLGAPDVLRQRLGSLVGVLAAARQLAHNILDQRAALLDAGASRDELADNHVLLQAAQIIDLA